MIPTKNEYSRFCVRVEQNYCNVHWKEKYFEWNSTANIFFVCVWNLLCWDIVIKEHAPIFPDLLQFTYISNYLERAVL